MVPRRIDPIDSKYRSYVENVYAPVPGDLEEKVVDNIISIAELAQDKKQTLRAISEHVARVIFKLFEFREIGIGLKSRTDYLYRYEVLFGYRKDVADSFRKVKYTYEDMVSQDKFPHIRMGKLSELNPVEGLPEYEKALVNRPYQLTKEREALDDFHEGDYIDFWLYGYNRELIGRIELSNPINGKLPSRSTVRRIELIASLCSSVIMQKWAEEEAARK